MPDDIFLRYERINQYRSSLDLINILNKGTKPIVAAGRQTYTAVIDITLASSDIASFVTEWRLFD